MNRAESFGAQALEAGGMRLLMSHVGPWERGELVASGPSLRAVLSLGAHVVRSRRGGCGTVHVAPPASPHCAANRRLTSENVQFSDSA